MTILAIALVAIFACSAIVIAGPSFNKDKTECIFDDKQCLPVPKSPKLAFYYVPDSEKPNENIWTCDNSNEPPRVIASDPDQKDPWWRRKAKNPQWALPHPCGSATTTEGHVQKSGTYDVCRFEEDPPRKPTCLPVPKDRTTVSRLYMAPEYTQFFCGQGKALRMLDSVGDDHVLLIQAKTRFVTVNVMHDSEWTYGCEPEAVKKTVDKFQKLAKKYY